MPLTPFDPLRRNVADTPEAEDAPLGILGIAADGNLVRVPDVRGEAGQGVPTGGTTGQVLAKTSSTNYATEWITLPASSAAAHVHPISDVTGLQAALDGKQAAGSYATAAQGALADSAVQPGDIGTAAAADTGDFAAAAHTHAIANVTGLQAALDAKQATLVSATNIKTVNGESLLGAGNLVIAGEGGSGVWGAITGTLADQTDLVAALAAKQDAGSYATGAQGALADSAVQPGDLATVATSGAYGDLSGLPTLGTAAAAATGDFAPAVHTHSIANVTGLQTALDGKQAAGSYATGAQGALADSAVQPADLADVATSGAYGDLTGLPTLGTAAAAATGDFAAAAHTHTIANVTGLQAALDGKQAAGSYATAAQGALADSAVQPGDLATVATTGAYSDLSGLPTLGTAAAAATGDFAAASHTHTIANVTGLQTALDGKAATSHTQAISTITGLQTALDGKAATSHTHSIANVTGLQAALDGKQAAGSYATAAQGALADSAVQPGDLATVATSGAYSDLSGLPTLGAAITVSATAPASPSVNDLWLDIS